MDETREIEDVAKPAVGQMRRADEAALTRPHAGAAKGDSVSRVTVVLERWRPHPLAWIHRAEARAVADELRESGRSVRVACLRPERTPGLPEGPLLLRLSDPVMFDAVRALEGASIPFLGPSAAAMERCYDKHKAYRIAATAGVACPQTALACEWTTPPFPLVLKPRRGSDSLGVRIVRKGPIPARTRTDGYLVQERVIGAELTVAVLRDRVGAPLRIALPEGVPYTFLRKYLLRPGRAPVTDTRLAGRVRELASRIAATLAIDWAARIDLIHEAETDRLCFLECDVAPLVGPGSAFADSLDAAGVERGEQLRLLLAGSG